jgi:hypothetical protein
MAVKMATTIFNPQYGFDKQGAELVRTGINIFLTPNTVLYRNRGRNWYYYPQYGFDKQGAELVLLP